MSDHRDSPGAFSINPAEGLVVCVLGLLGIGVVFVYSSSYLWATHSQSISDGYYLMRRQLLYILVSLLIMMGVSHLRLERIKKLSPYLYGGALLLLGLVLIPSVGNEVFGARRWIRFGSVGIQPSELAKIGVVLMVAWYAVSYPDRMERFFGGIGAGLALIGVPAVLVFMEPDLGTGSFLIALGLAVGIPAGMKLRYLIPMFLGGVPLVLLLFWNKFHHFRERLEVFLNPGSDPLGTGHQVRQSLIALGSGGVFGKGLGNSVQKMFFLPQHASDFIFSVIGEEIGLIGTVFIIILFAGVLWFGFSIAVRSRDRFGRLVATGLTLSICAQAILNIAVSVGYFPTKGVPLPFISYGGSSMFATMAMVGILLSIHSASQRDDRPAEDE